MSDPRGRIDLLTVGRVLVYYARAMERAFILWVFVRREYARGLYVLHSIERGRDDDRTTPKRAGQMLAFTIRIYSFVLRLRISSLVL